MFAKKNSHKIGILRLLFLGCKLSRRILSACWDPIISVLSEPLEGNFFKYGLITNTPVTGVLTEAAREDIKHRKAAVIAALDGLQRAARLSNVLGMSKAFIQPRNGVIFYS